MRELQHTFYTLLARYGVDTAKNKLLWQDLTRQYSGKKRAYHNLSHLAYMLVKMQVVQDLIIDWDTMLFSLFYHDYIYDATKKNNEYKSALHVQGVMQDLDISATMISKTTTYIMATQSHAITQDVGINYFIDIDMAILGDTWQKYQQYYKAVRKEYAVYPDFLYNRGRKKVLQHFLEMPTIFKTDYFYDTLEENARDNLKKELAFL